MEDGPHRFITGRTPARSCWSARILTVILALAFLSISGYEPSVRAQAPLKFLSSCEIDLNADSKVDIALLVDTVRGRELIVLINTGKGYSAFLLSSGTQFSILSCKFGPTVKETTAYPLKGRVFKTNGTYLELGQPEGASVAYFWSKGGFQQVWTSD